MEETSLLFAGGGNVELGANVDTWQMKGLPVAVKEKGETQNGKGGEFGEWIRRDRTLQQ